MPEKRKNQRYKTQAQARIPNILEGENVVRDISITGCCIEYPVIEYSVLTEIKPETVYQMEIMPEKNAKINNFVLEVEVKWLRSIGNSGVIGFSVVASPKEDQFQRYVDYLAYRSSRR
jgi:hypothetical protein